MVKRALAAMLISGSVMAVFAAAFMFSCCVLPFHRQIHAMVPLCHVANVLAAQPAETDGDSSLPAERKPDETRRATLLLPAVGNVVLGSGSIGSLLTQGSALARGRHSQGAMRSDQDVGLLTLLAISRI